MMLTSTILIALVTQSAIASPFNFPDESTSRNKQKDGMVMPGIYFHEPARSSKSLDNEEPESRNKQNEEMLYPGIYFHTPKSGKTLDSENNPPAAILFGPYEPVRLPSMDSIRLSPQDNSSKQDAPKNNEVIFFGEEPGDVDVNVNSGTTDKSDSELIAVLFFDAPASGDNIDRVNDNLPVMNPVPASFDIPVMNNFSKFENNTEHTLELGIPVIITIDNKPIDGFLHFINSTNYNQTISSIGDLRDSSLNDTNLIQTSSESPVLFFNHIEDEAMNDDGGITNFLFPTPKSTDFTEENNSSLDTLNATNPKTCKSGKMLYNDSCYQLLTSGPCGNGSWLISKNGYSAECEERKCATGEVFLNNSCVVNNSNVCVVGKTLYENQSGFGHCQCENGKIFYQDECHYLLGQGPCGEGNWLIMRDLTNVVCAPRQCALGKILYNNMCVDPEDSTICASGQMLYVDLTGDAYCDCDPDFIYIPHDGKCIPEYERGYCVWGEYLVWNEEEELECVKNPCGVDGHIYHNATQRCYEKKYIGYCKQDLLEIKGGEAECIEIISRNIFEVPTLRRCPRGSARDVLHECRRRYSMPSRSSILTSKHLYGGCRSGWTKGPNGRCKKIVNMFG